MISQTLAAMCRKGYLTINSQPAINGELSCHPVYGWGGSGGRVYQKAYVEFFCNAEKLEKLIESCKSTPNLKLYAVDAKQNTHGTITANAAGGATAVTWGVFPNREILQPTVFDPSAFLVWSGEAFQLWIESWASIYDDEAESCSLIYDIHDSFFLVAIVDNDYFNSQLYTIFSDN